MKRKPRDSWVTDLVPMLLYLGAATAIARAWLDFPWASCVLWLLELPDTLDRLEQEGA